MTSGIRIVVGLGVVGCATQPPEPLAFCEGSTRATYDPLSSPTLTAWPDDFYTQPDANSPNQRAVRLDDDNAPWIRDLPPLLQDVFYGTDGVTGFARQGAAFLTFDGPIGADLAGLYDAPDLGDPLVWLDLSQDSPEPIPFEAVVEDEGQQLRLLPLRPLRGGALHAVALTASYGLEGGGCVAPTDRQIELLSAESPDDVDDLWRPTAEGYRTLLDRTGWRPDDLSHLTVFTTQDATPGLRALADALRAESPSWAEPPVCQEPRDDGRVRCDGRATLLDARDDDGAVRNGDAPTPWELDVILWLPEVRGPSTPLTLYGHGINGRASDGNGRVADRLVGDLGHVQVAADALAHGDHPTRRSSGLEALTFLGIDLGAGRLDPRQLQGNFLQTVLDRIQLLHLLRQDPDLTGDGLPDFDPNQIGYWGVSLGGLLGPGLLALSDDVDAAVLSVAGGSLIDFALGSEQVALITPLLTELAGTEANLQRLLSVAQSAVDAADPAVLAAHVLNDRLGSDPVGPHLLLPVSPFDGTVPPSTGKALARGFPLPHLGPVVSAVPPLDEQALPTSANVDGVTAGYVQLDRHTTRDGEVEPSDHELPFRPEAYHQLLAFFRTWAEDGVPTIVDPYAELSVPPLPPQD